MQDIVINVIAFFSLGRNHPCSLFHINLNVELQQFYVPVYTLGQIFIFAEQIAYFLVFSLKFFSASFLDQNLRRPVLLALFIFQKALLHVSIS